MLGRTQKVSWFRCCLHLLISLMLVSCSAAIHADARPMSSEASIAARGMLGGEDVDASGLAQDSGIESAGSRDKGGEAYARGTQQRKVVYTALYTMRTSNLDVALARSKALAESMGGWVQQEGNEGIVFRVPADKFWETTRKIQEIGRILDHTIQSRDVTEEYTDLGIRLSVRKKFLAELQALYAKGGSLQDLLAVKKEIDRVTEEIERLEGKIRYLRDQIDWSTIRLRFQVQSESVTRDFNLPFRWLQSLGIQTLMNAREE